MAQIRRLSVDQLSQLLREYLGWPEFFGENIETQAREFYLRLSSNLDPLDLQELTSGLPGIEYFLTSNQELVAACKYIKSRDTRKSNNIREEARVHINTQVFALVYDCIKDVAIEGTIVRGIMMDMARTGMRIETTTPIPSGSILSMTVAHTGSTVTLYHLTGEVRWVTSTAESNHLGISIFNIEDFDLWQEFFSMAQTER